MMFWSFFGVFIFCEAGEMITLRFEQICDDIGQCDWYLYPAETQKILPIIIQCAQQPVTLRAFGKASCTRESFKTVSNRLKFTGSVVMLRTLMQCFCVRSQVVNSAFSYFLILREFQL